MKRSAIIAAAGLILVGLAGGLLLQKYVGAGTAWRWATQGQPAQGAPVDFDPAQQGKVITILTLGQSNAASHGWARAAAGPRALAFADGEFYPGSDPWAGCTGTGGSVWSRLAPRLLQRFEADTAVVACCAVGSSTISDWAPGGQLFRATLERLHQLRARGLEPDWVVWHQGESDAIRHGRDALAYEAELRAIIGALRDNGVAAPVLTCLASIHRTETRAEDIRQAQRSVWSIEERVYAGMDTDTLGLAYRSDRVHFNDDGLDLFARGLLLAMERESVTRAITLSDLE